MYKLPRFNNEDDIRINNEFSLVRDLWFQENDIQFRLSFTRWLTEHGISYTSSYDNLYVTNIIFKDEKEFLVFKLKHA